MFTDLQPSTSYLHLHKQINVPVFKEMENKNPVEIAEHAILQAKQNRNDGHH